MPTGYGLAHYGRMVTDPGRIGPYAQALRRAVRPGCTVVDIGAGPGYLALLACQYGAGEVHLIEPHESIEVARLAAAQNGFADRMVFHPTLSSMVTLARRADVIVSDLRGVIPMFEGHISAIVDARTRLLAPGGVLIPQLDRLCAAVLTDDEIYKQCEQPWSRNEHGLDLTAGRPVVVNSLFHTRAKAEQLLTDAGVWAQYDYRAVQQPNLDGEVRLRTVRDGTAHGISVWFDAQLLDEIGYSNAPGSNVTTYGQMFLPLEKPVPLREGNTVEVFIRVVQSGGTDVWEWQFRALDGSKELASFRQSTFLGEILTPASLRRLNPQHAPTLAESGAATRFVLEQMDGTRTTQAIAQALQAKFPRLFMDAAAAQAKVQGLAARYGI